MAVKKFPQLGVGNHRIWIKNFLKRNRKLIRIKKPRHGKRIFASTDLEESITKFIDRRNELEASYHFINDCIVNIDETKAEPPKRSDTKCKYVTTLTGDLAIQYTRATGCVTVVAAVTASGCVPAILCIHKLGNNESENSESANAIIQDPSRLSRNMFKHYTAFTKNGFMNRDLWVEFLGLLNNYFNTFYRDQNRLYLYDAATCHQAPEFFNESPNNLNKALPIPPLTTLFLQPLDDVPFALYKKFVAKTEDRINIDGIPRRSNSISTGYDIMKALNQTFKKEVIIKGFRNCGIVPFDSEKIWRNYRRVSILRIEEVSLPEITNDPDTMAIINEYLTPTLPIQFKKVKFPSPTKQILETQEIFNGTQQIIPSPSPTPNDSQEIISQSDEEVIINYSNINDRTNLDRRSRETLEFLTNPLNQNRGSKLVCLACTKRFKPTLPYMICSICEIFIFCKDCKTNPQKVDQHQEECILSLFGNVPI